MLVEPPADRDVLEMLSTPSLNAASVPLPIRTPELVDEPLPPLPEEELPLPLLSPLPQAASAVSNNTAPIPFDVLMMFSRMVISPFLPSGALLS